MAGSNGASEVAKDVQELAELSAACTRPRVKAMIDAYLEQLRAVIASDDKPVPRYLTPMEVDQHPLQSSASGPVAEAGPATVPAETVVSAPAPAVSAPAAVAAPAAASAPAPAVPTSSPAESAPGPPPPTPVRLSTGSAPASSSDLTYVGISNYGWDQDEYGKEPNYVYIYLTSGMDGVGAIKDQVSCTFENKSVDLKIIGLGGKNYRLVLTNLDKEIAPAESKAIVKKNMIKLKLRKVKGTYGYDSWIDLKSKTPKKSDADPADPTAGIMDMMKQMYDDGDDTMKKTLGEAMLKSRQGQMTGQIDSPSLDDDF